MEQTKAIEMVSESVIATIVAIMVTLSFPFYLYGAWIILDTKIVTWDILVRHLTFIGIGLTLNTIPVIVWMIPRLLAEFEGISVFHAFFGIQAYAMLGFALTGIIRIFQVKRKHDLYEDPNKDIELDKLHENMPAWRRRLRVGVFGYLVLWIIAWIIGMAYYILRYPIL